MRKSVDLPTARASMAVLLHNVRSARNVGSIFRTADAAGVCHLYLSGYTPTPTDRFGRLQKDIDKTALGAQRSVPWSHVISPKLVIKKLRSMGWKIVGVEQDIRSVDYRTIALTQPTLFIFGNEVRGISHNLRSQCDSLLQIPMHGQKESLNVSVAAGIVLFSMR